MACTTGTLSVKDYENCLAPILGLVSYPGIYDSPQVDAQYAIVAKRNTPPGIASWFANACETSLRARGLLIWKNSPGDCPAPQAPGGFTSGQIVGLSGQAASGVIGGLGAVGTLSGVATFGIGTAVSLAVSAISGIFAHHAQAVQTEQATLCQVAGFFNPILKQIDQAVLSGQITDQEGIVYVKQLTNQAISGLQGIYKSCNSACYQQAVLRAHADFVGFFYPLLSPIDQLSRNRPGQAPSTINAPGGVVDSLTAVVPLRSSSDPGFAYRPSIVTAGPPLAPNSILPSGCSFCPDYLNQGYSQQTGQSGQYADVPPRTQINWTMWGAIAAIILLLLVVFK